MKKTLKIILYILLSILALSLLWVAGAYYYFYHYNNLNCAPFSLAVIEEKKFILKNACNNYDRIMGSSIYKVEKNEGIAMIFDQEKTYNFIGSRNPYQLDVVFVDKNFIIKKVEALKPYTDEVVSGEALIVLELVRGSINQNDIGKRVQLIYLDPRKKD